MLSTHMDICKAKKEVEVAMTKITMWNINLKK